MGTAIDIYNEHKETLLETTGIPTKAIPRLFPLAQNKEDSQAFYTVKGVVAGMATGAAVGFSAKKFVNKNASPLIGAASGALIGGAKNAITFKKDSSGTKRDDTKEKQKAIGQKKNSKR